MYPASAQVHVPFVELRQDLTAAGSYLLHVSTGLPTCHLLTAVLQTTSAGEPLTLLIIIIP
jgi:hypothetical protein